MKNAQIFTIFDSKAQAYLIPFFEKTNALAIRAFTSAVNDSTHQFSTYPEDYTLFHLGEYDEDTAELTTLPSPQSLGVAIEYKSDTQEV